MRRVNNITQNTHPLMMFSRGIENIVSEKIAHPTPYQDYELNAIARKELAILNAEQEANASRIRNPIKRLRKFFTTEKSRLQTGQS